ncbi:L-histidine N(alpha)-methyltransferase [Pseudomarimonas salicorniae]|uniref:L-histidine N(Alpha)-methyltransferase n=1 Tax=Pseudomarimonas salicorniae TaxID=2933270 RepID=A0ABT0GK00_9GAMM|nr:L-histidine N(alpha)-methyltransferase [Lysobacter sp. CAU 1642]MCK7594861.1 L-histidine N(alpha)-methyltransferase [Lysobacter sp. CAU 1642]
MSQAVRVLDLQPEASDIRRDVLEGLARTPKQLPSKYFYDARGSELFEAICEQPEYYLTRTELAILDTHMDGIARALGERVLLLEFGSGSGIKTRKLLAGLVDPVGYVPIDISISALTDSAIALRQAFPRLCVLPVCADFTQPLQLPTPQRSAERKVMFFPGSTLGNFAPADALSLLRRIRALVGEGGGLLLGVDMKKDVARLEAAYNDAAGVTAAFTLNLLERLNRELDADFDLSAFRHRARYNPMAGRIETHLVSQRPQVVQIAGSRFSFDEGEAMLVEYSAKYDQDDIDRLARQTGFAVEQRFSDPAGDFSLQCLRAI